ncbi:MAG: phosphopantetheinyl transferase [Rhodobacterales bacterium]|nr:MAG: phosphopantetheinyl transferase [Rhodobacterales bacterium]
MALDSTYSGNPPVWAKAAMELLPPGLVLAWEDPALSDEGLFAVEEVAMHRAVPARRAEFAAGRRAAHRLLEQVMGRASPIPMGPDRAPLWPGGVVGSLSHCPGACVAVAGRADDIRAVGVDIEPYAPLDPALFDIVATARERGWLETLPPTRRGLAAKCLFSAKEAVFKSQYGITGKMLDFHDLECVLDVPARRVAARFAHSVPFGFDRLSLETRIQVADGFIFCISFEV